MNFSFGFFYSKIISEKNLVFVTDCCREKGNEISVEMDQRTGFLKTSLCSQTWSRGTSVCMCTLCKYMFFVSRISERLIHVCSCALCVWVCVHQELVSANISLSMWVQGSVCLHDYVSVCVCVCKGDRDTQSRRFFIRQSMKEVKEDAKEAGKEQSRVTGLSAGKLNFRHTYTQIHYTL